MEKYTDSSVLIEGYIGLNAYWLAEIDSDYKNKGEDYLFGFIKEIINNYKAEIATAIAEVTEGSVTIDSIKNSFRVPQQKVKEI